jgi:DUF4097 and DUF4098 domain-containing protein YvlB
MKGRIFVVVLLVAVAAFAGRWVNRMGVSANPNGVRREETRQTFRLEPGAHVEVRKINGAVTVKTADIGEAEVHIVRTANSPEDLEYGRVNVEASESSLVVRGERQMGGLWHRIWNGGGQVRHEVTLVLPRRVELSAGHVNGSVSVGEVEGSVQVLHVNGRVEVAQSAGRSEVSHVNGGVKFGVAQLSDEGMDVSHVNGNVEVRLSQLVDADIETAHHNGALSLNVPNVTMQERMDRSNMRARFGAGGAPVQINHVNGNVRFESDASSAPAIDPAEAARKRREVSLKALDQ